MTPTPQQRRRMTITAGIAVAVVISMTGLAFAAVPLYDMFCRVTGYGGTTQTATAAPSAILDRTVEVRFDTNVAAGLPVEFTPAPTQTLRLGETGLAFYEVRNLSDQPIVAVASYNVAPHKVGIYFQKLECFCFQNQVLAPGAETRLPVVFFVDPELASNPETEEVRTVTLSYTFFPSNEDAAADLEANAAP